MLEEKGISRVVVAGVLVVLIIATAGIYLLTRPSENKTGAKVVFWYSYLVDEETITLNAIQNSFTQKYPDITVESLNVTDMRTRLLAAIPAGKGPDVFTWAHDWTGEFADAGYILPLDNFLTPEIINLFTPESIAACTYDNKIWGLPYAAETWALIYNKALISHPPETMDEFIAMMEDWDTSENTYGLGYPTNTGGVAPWIYAFGGWTWSDENKTLGVNSAGTIAGVRYWIDTFKRFMPIDLTRTVQTAVFLENMAPFLIDGPWVIPSVVSAGIDYGVVPLPKINELDNKMPVPFTGFKMVWLASAAEKKENALTFIKWFCTDNGHILERAIINLIPVLKETLALEEVQANPTISGFSAAVAYGTPYPNGKQMGLVWLPFDTALQNAFLDNTKLVQYLNDAQAEIEADIATAFPGG